MDNITKYLNNVAYKFDKGYPDGPEDMARLFEMVNNLIKEEEEIDLKSELKKLIDTTNLSDETLQKLIKNITNSTFRGDLSKYINAQGFTADKFKAEDASINRILDKLSDTETPEFLEYIKNPKKFSSAPDKGNFIKYTGLSDKLVKDLINIEPGADATGSSVGKAEVFLALVFNDIDNRSGGGDLNFEGKNLEVKGTGGRLGQQPGRGSNANYLEILGDKFLDGDELEEFLNDGSNSNINYAIKDIYDRATKNGTPSNEVIGYIQKILDQVFFNKGLAQKYFNGPQDFKDLAKMKKNLLKLNTEAYAEKTNVGAFLFINSSTGDYVLVETDKISDIVDAGLIDTRTKNPNLGYKWNDPNPNIVIR